MMRILIILCLLTLPACSAMDILGLFGGGSGPSLEVDTTVGDKEEAVVSMEENNNIEAETVITNNTEELPIEYLAIMILGWLLPSPSEIYKEVKSWFTRRKV